MLPPDLVTAAADLLVLLRRQGLRLTTAESCTGGLIAAILTEVAGSSDVFERGFVTYSNASKTDMVGVPAELILRHGAVSEPVARAMAEGALAHSSADIAVAVTGVAGPGGGSAEKPVGLVHIAATRRGAATMHRRCDFAGRDRSGVRRASVEAALDMVVSLVRKPRN